MAARLVALGLLVLAACASASTVSYDSRAITVDGTRQLLLAGAIHYPRSLPSQWPLLMTNAKSGGINLIQTYVFWDLHEPVRGQYDFSTGSKNLPRFLEEAKRQGLFVNLRIGPYVCAEWNNGGFPYWLYEIPGMVIRTDNEPFKNEMATFVKKVVDVVQPYLASNGGPIILLQIENEYGNVQWSYGDAGKRYIEWAASFANSLNTSEPWLMCQQDDVASVLNAVNGHYGDNWISGHRSRYPNKPALFTENWPGWFQGWGEAFPTRPAEDVAFSVARWFARGGTYMAYYMYHGGTNFGRTSGGPYITTSYDYDAPLAEDGSPSEPKYSHLAALHKILLQYKDLILAQEATYTYLESNLEVHSYGDLSFISNIDSGREKVANFQGRQYNIKPWSTSLVFKGEVLYSTAVVTLPVISRAFFPVTFATLDSYANEPIPRLSADRSDPRNRLSYNSPQSQLPVTHDTTDYLYYLTSIPRNATQLTISSVKELVRVYLDGVEIGFFRAGGGKVDLTLPSSDGNPRELAILTIAMGLQNYGSDMSSYQTGILGSVQIDRKDFIGEWVHVVGLKGEVDDYVTKSSAWTRVQPQENIKSVVGPTWLRFKLNVSKLQYETSSYWLRMDSMTKGIIVVNGFNIGRYWDVEGPQSGCKENCNYAGNYDPSNCRRQCGQKTQIMYHVPQGLLREGSNDIVLFEETAGDVTKIRLYERRAFTPADDRNDEALKIIH